MKHIWSILCKKSVIDADTNSLSIQDCIDEFKVVFQKDKIEKIKEEKKTVIPVQFELVHLVFDEDTNKDRGIEIKTELYDPKNEKLGDFSGKFTLEKQKRRFRARIKMKGFPVTVEGTYLFNIKIKEKNQDRYTKVAEIPLDVKIERK